MLRYKVRTFFQEAMYFSRKSIFNEQLPKTNTDSVPSPIKYFGKFLDFPDNLLKFAF